MPRKDGFELLGWLRSHLEFNVIPRVVFRMSDPSLDKAAAGVREKTVLADN
ncbi:MAG TPA: hypothetical protein VK530_18040 [Candidatus Acidoferrum sp.]|nr:hypothetical protein [Candidatus Acidoferrum sp.]